MNGAPTLKPLPRTLAVLERGRAEGLHVGAQVYASVDGRVVADFAAGLARTAPDVPMTPDTLMLWMSATKPIAAVAVAQLWEKGFLELDDPVAKHLEPFGRKGKERVTIRHLLTHTGGFRALVGRWEEQPWDDIIAAVCDARLEPDWIPGRKAGYHLATSWYVLGELVHRLDPLHRPFERYVREMIFEPLGMIDSWVGLPPDRYRAYGDRIGFMHDTTEAAGASRAEAPHAPHPSDTEPGAAACRPGSNGRGPARELAFFYEMLLARGQRNGRRVLSPQSVEAITAPHRVGLYDHTFRHTMDWGLGFLINSSRYPPRPRALRLRSPRLPPHLRPRRLPVLHRLRRPRPKSSRHDPLERPPRRKSPRPAPPPNPRRPLRGYWRAMTNILVHLRTKDGPFCLFHRVKSSETDRCTPWHTPPFVYPQK